MILPSGGCAGDVEGLQRQVAARDQLFIELVKAEVREEGWGGAPEEIILLLSFHTSTFSLP
jgi:hypothetical protein